MERRNERGEDSPSLAGAGASALLWVGAALCGDGLGWKDTTSAFPKKISVFTPGQCDYFI